MTLSRRPRPKTTNMHVENGHVWENAASVGRRTQRLAVGRAKPGRAQSARPVDVRESGPEVELARAARACNGLQCVFWLANQEMMSA